MLSQEKLFNINEILNETEILIGFDDIIIIEEAELDMIINMLSLEKEINKIERTTHYVKINDKYLVILTSIGMLIKSIWRNFLCPLNKILRDHDKNKGELLTFLKEFHIELNSTFFIQLDNLCNVILLFTPDFYSIYNIKRRISTCHIFDIRQIINDYYIINVINTNNRKCSISWNYRLYLVTTYKGELANHLGKIHSCDIRKFQTKLETISQLFLTGDDREEYDTLLLYDLFLVDIINEKEKRNYHLWKYTMNLYHHYQNKTAQGIILSFCLFNFINNSTDYSAYSNIRNTLTSYNKEKLKAYLIHLLDNGKYNIDSIYFRELLEQL